MSRQFIARLLLAVTLLGTMAACGKSPTAPDARVKTHDTIPWN
jgi:predicted small lipoprotein YifL